MRHHLCVHIGIKWFEAAGSLAYGGRLSARQLKLTEDHINSNAKVVLFEKCERRHPGRRFAWNARARTSGKRAWYDFVEEVCAGGLWTPEGYQNPCRSVVQVICFLFIDFIYRFSFMYFVLRSWVGVFGAYSIQFPETHGIITRPYQPHVIAVLCCTYVCLCAAPWLPSGLHFTIAGCNRDKYTLPCSLSGTGSIQG